MINNLVGLFAVTAEDVLSKVLYILVAFLVLLFMITIHELGHYTAGKLLGFKINEFAIGMGPKIFSKKHGPHDEVFSVRLLPLGGFCSFEGEDEDENENPEAFNRQKPWKRLIVLFSGAFFNFISAILIAIIAFSCFGEFLVVVDKVEEYSPNYENGSIEKGDVILSINGKTMYLVSDMPTLIKESGDSCPVVVFRPYDATQPLTQMKEGVNGEKVELTVKKATYTTDIEGVTETYTGWGITRTYTQSRVRYTFGESITRSVPYCNTVGALVLKTLGQLVTGVIGLDNVGGPITTIDIASQVVATGFANILYLITLISVNLAVFNLLPIPALDGCRMVFVIIEWIRGKPVNRKVEGYIHFVGLVLLLVFVVLIDVLKWF